MAKSEKAGTHTSKAPQGESLASKTRRRKAQLGQCPHCHAWTLRGVDNDWAGFKIEADAVYLTWAGEIAAAFLEGRHTYTITATGRLEYRDADRRRRPPRNEPALTEHLCGQPIPAPWRADLPPIPADPDPNAPPPF